MRKKLIELSRTHSFAALVALILVAALIAALKPVKIKVIIDGKARSVYSNKVLVRDILEENQITFSERDLIQPSPNQPVADNGFVVRIFKAKRAVLQKEGFKEVVYSRAANIKGFLADLEAANLSSFFVNVSVSSGGNYAVTFVPIRTAEVDYTSYFDHRGRAVLKPEPLKSHLYGIKKIKVRRIYRGEVLLASVVLGEKILKKPEALKRTLIARHSLKLRSRGKVDRTIPAVVSEKNYLVMVATAYAPGAGAGWRTATNRKAGYGIVAVDPRVIPLGTRLYIPGYGYAIAADTGGAIKGNRIDLCFNTCSEAIRWGRREVKVYILK
jgi:3D (Asp-Asp-Asp) domain-containing protein